MALLRLILTLISHKDSHKERTFITIIVNVILLRVLINCNFNDIQISLRVNDLKFPLFIQLKLTLKDYREANELLAVKM